MYESCAGQQWWRWKPLGSLLNAELMAWREVAASWAGLGETHFLHENACWQDCGRMAGYLLCLGWWFPLGLRGLPMEWARRECLLLMGRGRMAWLELIKKRAALGVIVLRATLNCRESSMGPSIYGCASLVSYFTIRVCFALIALLCIMMQVC
jgi:hypothetical protein